MQIQAPMVTCKDCGNLGIRVLIDNKGRTELWEVGGPQRALGGVFRSAGNVVHHEGDPVCTAGVVSFNDELADVWETRRSVGRPENPDKLPLPCVRALQVLTQPRPCPMWIRHIEGVPPTIALESATSRVRDQRQQQFLRELDKAERGFLQGLEHDRELRERENSRSALRFTLLGLVLAVALGTDESWLGQIVKWVLSAWR